MADKAKNSPFLRQCFVTSAVCLNIVSYGNMMGYPAVLLPQLQQPGSIVTLTINQVSWISSSIAVSMLVGNFCTPSLMDRLGRRPAHLFICIVAITGWMLIALASSFETMISGRFILGFAFGMMLPLRSALIGEYTSPNYRGAFLTTASLAQAFGVFLVHLLGTFLHWQVTALICAFFPLISFTIVTYSPESPSFLAANSQYDECRDAYRWLRGSDEENELTELIKAREAFDEVKHNNSYKELLSTIRKREFYKPITIMIHANAILIFSGTSAMSAYSTTIIGLILGPGANAHFWMLFLDVQRLVSNSFAVYMMDKLKRRTMFLVTGGLCILSHLAIALYVYASDKGYVHANWIPIVLINLQFFTIATGMVPLPTVIAGEIFPLQYRSIGSSISIFGISVFTFTVLQSFPGLIDGIGIQGTYLLYAGILSYILAVIWIMLPETKGKTLQQIEEEFKGRPLKPEEIEARMSLQSVVRKGSMYSCLSVEM